MQQTRRPSRRRESGSAYIIALLVLVVLTLLGLGLAVITQTEVQIGANELTTHRTLYGSEGGVNMAIARVLTVNSSVDNATVTAVTPMRFAIPETRMTLDSSGMPEVVVPPAGGLHHAELVELTPFVPIRDSYCDGCPAGEGDVKLLNVNHALVATSRRVSWFGSNEPTDAELQAARQHTTASKQLYLMVGLQPWWPPKWEAIADESQVSSIAQHAFEEGLPSVPSTP